MLSGQFKPFKDRSSMFCFFYFLLIFQSMFINKKMQKSAFQNACAEVFWWQNSIFVGTFIPLIEKKHKDKKIFAPIFDLNFLLLLFNRFFFFLGNFEKWKFIKSFFLKFGSSINLPRVMSVASKFWTQSVQPFCHLLDTNKQTPRQAKYI